MAYKVSYKVLRQQGEDIKAAAKLLDGYAERVGQIRGRLGSDDLLSQVRSNLQKLQGQLGESRAILNTAGEFLIKTVEGYTGVEVRQVKKVDGARAHNRDFYKNPVVVASAGGAAGAGAAFAPATVNSTTVNSTTVNSTTVNYTGNTVNLASSAPEPAAAGMAAVSAPVAQTAAAAPVSMPAATTAPVQTASSSIGGIAAGALGGAAASGIVTGAVHMKKKHDEEQARAHAAKDKAEYDPDAELHKAIERVRSLE